MEVHSVENTSDDDDDTTSSSDEDIALTDLYNATKKKTKKKKKAKKRKKKKKNKKKKTKRMRNKSFSEEEQEEQEEEEEEEEEEEQEEEEEVEALMSEEEVQEEEEELSPIEIAQNQERLRLLTLSGSDTSNYHIAVAHFHNKHMYLEFNNTLSAQINENSFDHNTTFNDATYTLGYKLTEGATHYLDGNIQEFIIYNHELDDYTIGKIKSYLNKKYNIY